MRFSYFYFMKDAPEAVREVVPRHAAYWRGLGLPQYEGGPFADRSGGLIMFETASAQDAERLAGNDPFVLRDLLEPPSLPASSGSGRVPIMWCFCPPAMSAVSRDASIL